MRTGLVLAACLFAVAPRAGAQKLEALWYSVGSDESTRASSPPLLISIVSPWCSHWTVSADRKVDRASSPRRVKKRSSFRSS
jgi:hypothetical protein